MIKLNIFSRLDDHAISDLAVKMFRVPTSSGMPIIEEGDAGEVFYVVRHGSYDVTVDKNNPMNKKTTTLSSTSAKEAIGGGGGGGGGGGVAEGATSSVVHCTKLEPGQVFGEGALLNATRLATVTCSSDSMYEEDEDEEGGAANDAVNDAANDDSDEKRIKEGGVLYGLHRSSYQKVVKSYEQRMKKERHALLKSIPMFTQGKLTNKDLLKLVDALEEEVFEYGTFENELILIDLFFIYFSAAAFHNNLFTTSYCF